MFTDPSHCAITWLSLQYWSVTDLIKCENNFLCQRPWEVLGEKNRSSWRRFWRGKVYSYFHFCLLKEDNSDNEFSLQNGPPFPFPSYRGIEARGETFLVVISGFLFLKLEKVISGFLFKKLKFFKTWISDVFSALCVSECVPVCICVCVGGMCNAAVTTWGIFCSPLRCLGGGSIGKIMFKTTLFLGVGGCALWVCLSVPETNC